MVRVDRIMMPWGVGPSVSSALRVALSLAKRFDAALFVLSVSSPFPSFARVAMGAFEGVQRRLRAQERKRLQDVISEGSRLGIAVEELTRIGAPAERVIVETARELDVDILVISEGRSGWIERHLLGDPAQFVVRHAPCSVFLVRTDSKGTPLASPQTLRS